MQPKHVVINETDGEAASERCLGKQPALLVWSSWVCGTGMGGFIFYGLTLLLSANSLPLFGLTREQTLRIHGSRKSNPPFPSAVFVKSLHPASLCCFVFSLIFTLPLVSRYVAPLCSSLRGHQQHRRGGATFNTRAREQCESFSSSDGGRIPVSVSSSSLSGSPVMWSFNKKKCSMSLSSWWKKRWDHTEFLFRRSRFTKSGPCGCQWGRAVGN